jgi:hypothetical protein
LTRFFAALIGAAALLSGSAHAALISLEIFEDNSLLTSFGPVSGGTLNLTAGGAFFTNINVKIVGDALADLDLNVSANSGMTGMTGTHNLTILATQYNLTPLTPTVTFTSNFSATTAPTNHVTLQNFANAANQPFAQTLSFAGPTTIGGTGSAVLHGSAALGSLAQFAETLVLTMEASGRDTITGRDIVVGVPEPSTWAMMLLGFAALAWAFRRRWHVA